MRHRLISMLVSAFAVAGAPTTATAAPVTFEVNLRLPPNPGPQYFSTNIIRDGIRISPNCHVDGGATGLADPALGFDSAGCGSPGGFNENFLGPAEYRAAEMTRVEPVIYVDAFGAPFALRQITIGSIPFILDTNRTSFTFNSGPTTFDFSANPVFDPITYFILRYRDSDPGAPDLGFTNLVVTLEKVPLPGSLLLTCAGLIGLAFSVRGRAKAASGTQARA